jgi:hypothetical protein
LQTTSKRLVNAKSGAYHQRKRGAAEPEKVRFLVAPLPRLDSNPSSLPLTFLFLIVLQKEKSSAVGPVMLGFFLFVVVGSGGLQACCCWAEQVLQA